MTRQHRNLISEIKLELAQLHRCGIDCSEAIKVVDKMPTDILDDMLDMSVSDAADLVRDFYAMGL